MIFYNCKDTNSLKNRTNSVNIFLKNRTGNCGDVEKFCITRQTRKILPNNV